jgi:hypothetical protein
LTNGETAIRQHIFIHEDWTTQLTGAHGLGGSVGETGPLLPTAVSERRFHELSPAMIRTNVPALAKALLGEGRLPHDGQVGSEFATERERSIRAARRLWWLMFDFGPDHEEVVNVVVSAHPLPFARGRLFLDASHDGQSWLSTSDEPLALDQLGWRGSPLDKRVWHAWNAEPYRYYRLIIDPGQPALDPDTLPRFRVGYTARVVPEVRYRTIQAEFPLHVFTREPASQDHEFVVMSVPLPAEMPVEVSTHPAHRFWYQFDLRWRDDGEGTKPLAPTWKHQWYRAGLFQMNYRRNGRLAVSVPAAALAHPQRWTIEMTTRIPDTGVEVRAFGANHLAARVHRDRAGWLYYADTWDPYWEATLDGKPIAVSRANLQYKAVPVPVGDHLVEFHHRPRMFFTLVGLSYFLQAVTLSIGIAAARSRSDALSSP